MTHRYAAVVLYYRAGDALRVTLRAIQAQTNPPEEILVVDNASGDGVVESLLRDPEFAGIRASTLARNEGYAGGMNRGRQTLLGGAEHVLFLTHETVLEVNAAEELGSAADSTGAVAVGPMLRRLRDGSVWSAGGTLSPSGETGHRRAPVSSSPYAVDWLDGAALFLQRDALDQIGGFDERYFLYWEDVDVCRRLATVGAIVCAPAAEASQETNSTPPYYASRNRIVFWRRHGSARVYRGAVRAEAKECVRDALHKRPHVKDATARALGILDALREQLHPRLGSMRSNIAD